MSAIEINGKPVTTGTSSLNVVSEQGEAAAPPQRETVAVRRRR